MRTTGTGSKIAFSSKKKHTRVTSSHHIRVLIKERTRTGAILQQAEPSPRMGSSTRPYYHQQTSNISNNNWERLRPLTNTEVNHNSNQEGTVNAVARSATVYPGHEQGPYMSLLPNVANFPLISKSHLAVIPGQTAVISAPMAFPVPQISRPILTVQDQPNVPPLFNGISPVYPNKIHVLSQNPPIFAVEDFLTNYECDFLISAASNSFTAAPVVGKGNGEVSPSRTSSTCYLAREDLPTYMAKICALTGKPVEHCELPQVGRYLPSQQYMQHYDAFDLSNEDGRRFASNGGQRVVTCLTYLNNVRSGGQTSFPALNLKVKPKKGLCVVFFPATVDGLLDKMSLHAAEPAVDVKYVSQVWIRQGTYTGQASRRLEMLL